MEESLTNEITDSIRMSSDALKAGVKSSSSDISNHQKVNESIRKTKLYTLAWHHENLYQTLFMQHKNKIERFFNLSLTRSTPVQALEYEVGAFYLKHADDSNDLVDKEGNCVGFNCVAPQRKLTSVLFATSHTTGESKDHYSFSGGELLFNYLYDAHGKGVELKPKAGDMVLFLSNPIFSHEVKKVLSGYRLSLVQWHDAIC